MGVLRIEPSLTFLIPGMVAGATFLWGALCSTPKQSSDADVAMLPNLILWTLVPFLFGSLFLGLLHSFFLSLLQADILDESWITLYQRFGSVLVILCLVAFELLGLHLALVRVERKRQEPEGRPLDA